MRGIRSVVSPVLALSGFDSVAFLFIACCMVILVD